MQKENGLFTKLDETKKGINALRGRLNETDRQKESWFRKKEDCSKKIKDSIKLVKEKRSKRDSLTKKVKEGKEKRNTLNKKIKNNISEIKKLDKEEKYLMKKHKIRDPSKIKGEIDKLELKIETEVMSFEKEKAIVKKIKELKKKFNEAEVLNDVLKKTRNVSKEINSLKKEAEASHSEIQKNAKESQLIHEEMIADSKEIDKLKVMEEEAFSKFLEFKKKFNEVNNILKDKLKDFNNINSEVQKARRKKEEKIIKDKEEFVQEKIRKGQKITTEDLLVFQKLGE